MRIESNYRLDIQQEEHDTNKKNRVDGHNDRTGVQEVSGEQEHEIRMYNQDHVTT